MNAIMLLESQEEEKKIKGKLDIGNSYLLPIAFFFN